MLGCLRECASRSERLPSGCSSGAPPAGASYRANAVPFWGMVNQDTFALGADMTKPHMFESGRRCAKSDRGGISRPKLDNTQCRYLKEFCSGSAQSPQNDVAIRRSFALAL